MIGVKFGDYHTYNDFNLILAEKEIGSPEVKKKEVEVEGSSVVLDYTEYFGEVKYSKRSLNFTFNTIVPQSEFMALYSRVLNALQGQRLPIILDAEPDYYYMGRLSVSSFTTDKNIGGVSIECDCEPWKYKVAETVVTQAVSGTKTINLTNSRKKVVPEVTTTASMTLSYGDYTSNIGAGTHIIPTLELSEGNNAVTVTGTGNITFTYREGGL